MLVENALMAELKNFGTPDEVREFPKGRLELIKVGGATIGRGEAPRCARSQRTTSNSHSTRKGVP